MEPYSPTPAPLPATISLPEDGIDQVVVSTVRTALEPIADAIAGTEADVVAVENDLFATDAQVALIRLAKAYQADVLGTSVPHGDYLEINNSDINEGFATFSIGGGGTELQFPNATDNDLRGIYRVTIDVMARTTDANNPAQPQILATIYDASGPTETTVAQLVGLRYSDDPSFPVMIHGSFLVDMTGLVQSMSRMRLKAFPGTGDQLTITSTGPRISVNRIGDGDP